MKKILITGISGFLGSQLSKYAPTNVELVGIAGKKAATFPNVRTIQADLTDEVDVNQLLATIRPDVVVHIAAQSNGNFCEQHPNLSYGINVKATTFLANYCARWNVPFLFTSTDLIFDGTAAPYSETDTPNPISVYGAHKWEAEEQILKIYPEATIARLPLLFGFSALTTTFFSDWVQKLKIGEAIYAFTDEYRTPASGQSVAEGIWLLVEKEVTGIWHLGGIERIARYDFAVKMAEALQLPTPTIYPSLRKDVVLPAARPEDVSLNSAKAFALGYSPKSIEEELKRLLSTL